MASTSGPEEFLINLLVLLLLMVVVVLLADRLLRHRGWMNLIRPRERKRRKRPAPEKVEGEVEQVSSARLTRNYYDSGEKRALSEREQEFGTLYRDVNDALNGDPSGAHTSSLMKRIDEQYIRMLSFFTDSKERGASLHMEHNYLWLKYRHKAEGDPNGAFMVLMQSLSKLMERQGVQPYAMKEFGQMMDRYDGTMGSLHQTKGFNINNATVGFFSFSARLNLMLKEHPDPVTQEAVGKVVIEFVRIMLERHYIRMVQSHFLSELRVEHIQAITDQVEGLRRVQESTGRPDPQVHMVCHYLVCRLRMAQLRIMATLEPSPGRAQDMHEAHMRKLANDAASSGSESARWAAMMVDKGDRSMVVQTELVSLLAAHFQATYAKRHVLESWNTMEAVRSKVVEEIVERRVQVAEELLICCDEEWKVLSSSTKEWFSRQARKQPSRTEGGIFIPMANDGGVRSLLYLSHVQERGVPPDTIIQILRRFKEETPPRRSWPSKYRSLLKALTGKGEVRLLELAGSSYIGAMLGPRFGLLIKATGDRIDAGSITVAVEACQEAGAREIAICANFANELVTAETLRRFFLIAERRSPRITFWAADTEGLASSLAGCLHENGSAETFELVPPPAA